MKDRAEEGVKQAACMGCRFSCDSTISQERENTKAIGKSRMVGLPEQLRIFLLGMRTCLRTGF